MHPGGQALPRSGEPHLEGTRASSRLPPPQRVLPAADLAGVSARTHSKRQNVPDRHLVPGGAVIFCCRGSAVGISRFPFRPRAGRNKARKNRTCSVGTATKERCLSV